MSAARPLPSSTPLMNRPPIPGRLHHVALNVTAFDACERFYTELLGMQVEWRPDQDNVYLTSGADNLALHRAPAGSLPGAIQRMDHIGFIVDTPAAADDWHEFLHAQGVAIVAAPRTHRDGARSFYCRDPDGNVIQIIYHPPLARDRF